MHQLKYMHPPPKLLTWEAVTKQLLIQSQSIFRASGLGIQQYWWHVSLKLDKSTGSISASVPSMFIWHYMVFSSAYAGSRSHTCMYINMRPCMHAHASTHTYAHAYTHAVTCSHTHIYTVDECCVCFSFWMIIVSCLYQRHKKQSRLILTSNCLLRRTHRAFMVDVRWVTNHDYSCPTTGSMHVL